MTRAFVSAVMLIVVSSAVLAATKPHVISFGKWSTVKALNETEDGSIVEFRVRALYVDGKVKEFTVGGTHEVSDRLFVAQRIERMNDGLPAEAGAARWVWEREGWIVVDRSSGHISAITLMDFDPDNTAVSWYRDYAAYCGESEDGKKLYAVVAQLGHKKPIVKKALPENVGTCDAPTWQRQPTRVTFASKEQKWTYAVRRHAAEPIEDDGEEEAAK